MDNQLFDGRIRDNQRKLAHLCTKLCGDYEDASDLYQETLLKAYVKFSLYDENQPFDKWIYSVCVNVHKNMARTRRNSVRTQDFATNEDKDYVLSAAADSWWERSEESNGIREALGALKVKYRTVVVLHYLSGYKVGEIAEIVKAPEGTVKHRLFKAREMLKRRLAQYEEDR